MGPESQSLNTGLNKVYEKPDFCPDLLISLENNQDKPFAQRE